jgi:ubiquinone biosynthesis protein UbiJ
MAQLPNTALKLASTTLNQAMQYAPAARQRLQDIGPLCCRLVVQDLQIELDIRSDGGQWVMDQVDDRVPDVLVMGQSKDLLTLLRSEDRTATLASLPIRVEGSTRAFMQLQGVASALDIDWDAWLGDWVGDLPARHVLDTGRAMARLLKQSALGFQRSTEQYLIRERRWLITQTEHAQLVEQQRVLRRQLDRLEHRMRLLQQQSQRES